MDEDCYFYTKIDEGVQKIGVLCLRCENKKPDSWFYKGSVLGYGPFNFRCSECGYLVHAKPEEEDEIS